MTRTCEFFTKAAVKRELLDTVKAGKLAYSGHTMRKQRSCLEKDNAVVVVVTFFNHNFVNCKATLMLAIKIYEIKYNISLNDIHT